MASTASLRSRRSAAQLHALAGVEREIRASDHNGRRKYLRDFSQAFRAYDSVLAPDQLPELLQQADIVLIGDYHALPGSQRFAASLIEEVARGTERPVVLGLETVFSRDQHILDEWLRNEIELDELRERIRFDLDWGYEWEPFSNLLGMARQHAQAIYGLDCMPRQDLRKIGARDRHAAAKLAEIRQRHPDALILVLFGESHLAPNHLPQLLRDRLAGERLLTVLQNVDTLYWKAAGESCDRVEAVRVAQDVICIFNATPLEKYENYRLCLDRWSQEGAGTPDLSPTIYNLIDGLLRFLGINLYSSHNTTQPRFLVDSLPEVCCSNSDVPLHKLLSRKGMTEHEKKAMLRRVEEGGSIYLPHLNTFYIREFQMMHAAEEAARFLHHACRGLPLRANGNGLSAEGGEDRFYTRALENALGYFGSRVLYPGRPAVRESELYELYDHTREDVEQQTTFEFQEFIRMVDFLALHRGFERNARRYMQRPKPIAEGLQYEGAKLDYVTRQLGYMLGSDLYDAYLEGRVTRRFLKGLFLLHLEQAGAAAAAYFATVRKVRAAKNRVHAVAK
ncbi:MAG TPA: ChaN family lipoprotein [Terriglobales bacterium]|nr:ChaN family lipoprotein [Terriglobales bacterium]